MGGKKWSDAEIITLRTHFPNLGYNIAALMQRRTHEAVRAKAKELGVKTPEQVKRAAMNARLWRELGQQDITRDYSSIVGYLSEHGAIKRGECAPCGKVRQAISDWINTFLVWLLLVAFISCAGVGVVAAFKAFGG